MQMRYLLPLLLLMTSHLTMLHAGDQPVRITVVVILASSESKEVDPRLNDLAKAIQKKDRKLTGLKLEKILQQSIVPGKPATFDLPEKGKLEITVEKPHNAKTDRIGLKVKAPGLKVLSYTCVCDKYFPIITTQKCKDGSTVIVAILAKPCTGKGP